MCVIIQITTEVRYTVRGREERFYKKEEIAQGIVRQARTRTGGLNREGVERAG